MSEIVQNTFSEVFSTEKYKSKLNEIVHLMLSNQLRKDIDDGLLEKLLCFFQTGCTSDNLDDLLKNSSLPQLFCSILKSLESNTDGFLPDVVSFSIRALGIFLRHPNAFIYLKEMNILHILCCMVENNPKLPYPPSIQVAILFCLASLTSNQEGRELLISGGFVDSSFFCLSASSYYVRKEAVEFFTSFLVNAASCQDETFLKQKLNLIVEQLISTLKYEISCCGNAFSQQSCALILKAGIEKCDFLQSTLCSQRYLLAELYEVWEAMENVDKLPDGMLDLIATCYKYRKQYGNHPIGRQEMIQLLMKRGLECEAISLSTKILLKEEHVELSLSSGYMEVILFPILLLKEKATGASGKSILPLQDEHKLKTALQMSFASLSKLASAFDVATLLFAFSETLTMLESAVSCESGELLSRISKNKRILSLSNELAIQVLCVHNFSKIPVYKKNLFLDRLIEVAKSSNDCRIICDVLKLIYYLVQQSSLTEAYFSDTLRSLKFAEVLQRKLFDHEWPVVDSCLEVIQEIISSSKGSETSSVLEYVIHKQDFHTAIWDIAFASEAEGYVRAKCIAVLTSMYFIPCLFEDLKCQRSASNDSFISTLCSLSEDPDVFIQRECISSLVRCLNLNNMKSNSKIFHAFVNAAHNSLDCQVKINVLKAWKLIRETYFSVLSLNNTNVLNTLQFLCDIGYGLTLLYSSSDSDRKVRSEAIQELLRVRQVLICSDLSALTFECSDDDDGGSSSSFICSDDSVFPIISSEARNKAIDEVLDMETVEQIENISVIKQDVQVFGHPVVEKFEAEHSCACSPKHLWMTIWSKDIEVILKASEKSSDIYADHPEALLDDIIAAKAVVGKAVEIEYYDADCY